MIYVTYSIFEKSQKVEEASEDLDSTDRYESVKTFRRCEGLFGKESIYRKYKKIL
jgi:hypothetical protein